MTAGKGTSSYRWVIKVILVLALASRALIWLAPAPLLPPIIRISVSTSAGQD